ncbi:MAG: hypothetical protein FJ253_07250 [Phycisphaerae bacterium]|nr:hypothetical protein [Phycisphaerae bacterium]
MGSPSSYPFTVGYNDSVQGPDHDAHRRSSVECFNRAWQLIELPRRTADENSEMLLLAMSSLWHWTQRPECGPRERSIGCWQVSRCAALAGHASLAREFAQRAIEHSKDLDPYLLGCAHECAARAAALDGDSAALERHRNEARRSAERVSDAEDRARLLADLESLNQSPAGISSHPPTAPRSPRSP